MSGERILVCGGRDFSDRSLVFHVLDLEALEHGIHVVIQGGASGADKLAREWCYQRQSIRMWNFPADWKKHGKAAGPIRNQQMLDEGKPTKVFAFPGGRGTADMVRRARAAGLPVHDFSHLTPITKDKSHG